MRNDNATRARQPLRIEHVQVEELRPAAYNPRRCPEAEREKLRRSIETFGVVDPIIARREGGEVVGGHLRLEVACELGFQTVPVVFVDGLTDEQARLLNLALNRISGDWDPGKLGGLLLELGAPPDVDLALSGFDLPEIARSITQHLRERAGLADQDEAPPLPPVAETRPGDVWRLGDHLLLCGDGRECTIAETESVDVLWTDPPYGVNYRGGTREALTIEGDNGAETAELLRRAFARADAQLRPGARIYLCHPAGQASVLSGQAFLNAGWRLHQTLVWVKDSLVLGRSDYHYRHEPVYYGYKPGPPAMVRSRRGWYADRRQSSVFEVPRPKASREHPTQKPVQLIEAHLSNSSRPSDLVLDPFIGSGSTLIACEKLGRRCYGIEIDPRYVDVAVRRWEAFTGRKAERDD